MNQSLRFGAFFLCLCFWAQLLHGQALQVNSASHTYASKTELQRDSFLLSISNPESTPVTITECRFYSKYQSFPFNSSTVNLQVPAGGNASMWVRFTPDQNVFYNSELVLVNNGKHGPIAIDLKGQGTFSRTYYSSTQNLEEEALKLELKSITGQGYRSLGYSPPCSGCQPCARDTMFMIIDNQSANGQGATQNTIECVYTGRQIVGYVDRTQCQNTADPYYNFNTEHTFPQNFFSSNEPMRSDMFHLFPTDETANGKRASFPFGIVSNPSWSVGGSKFSQSAGIFEPRDVHKGQVARAMFYFVIRYQNYSNFLDSQESILRQWNEQFAPSAVEHSRCDNIALYQHNRNPFIDYPQLTRRITSISTTSAAAIDYSLDFIEDSIHMAGVTSANAEYNYVVVNKGNQPVSFSGFQVQPAVFSFASGFSTATQTIQPGDALTIPIVLNTPTGGFYTGTLQLNSTDPAHSSSVIPIDANVVTIGVNENSVSNKKLIVYPNPSNGTFCFEQNSAKASGFILYDVYGRVVSSGSSECGTFPTDAQSGIYLIRTADGQSLIQLVK